VGGGPILPALAQPAAYTSAQLQAFRAGERRNDADRVMRELARRLSDADIAALADYYAGR
jgi:cytochrome c553